jgi:hypothetical protein
MGNGEGYVYRQMLSVAREAKARQYRDGPLFFDIRTKGFVFL